MPRIIVADIDDTLLHADPKSIAIYKSVNNGPEISLSTDEFAKDPDKNNPDVTFDMREFCDPAKVRNSIIKGTPLLHNLKIIDIFLRKGFDFAFSTARSLEEVVSAALYEFLMFRDTDGNLKKLGPIFKKSLSKAINDEKYSSFFGRLKDFERKAAVLQDICFQYDHVLFIDDDARNITAAKKLALSNLHVITAQ